MNVRFLDENDYSACVDVVLAQKDVIEKYYKEDYRYWIQPLSGWLHYEPYEKFRGNFLSQDKKLAGYFYKNKLISFAGLICYPQTDVAIYTYRVSNQKSNGFDSKKAYTEKTKFLFKWAESKRKRNIFSSNHPKISESSRDITASDEYLNTFDYSVLATYEAGAFPQNSWHQEIMEFSYYPNNIDICQWSKKFFDS